MAREETDKEVVRQIDAVREHTKALKALTAELNQSGPNILVDDGSTHLDASEKIAASEGKA